MKVIRFLIILSLAVGVVGCCKKRVDPPILRTEVKFSTSISAPTTRTSGTSWDNGDAIGVFMTNSGTPLQTTSLATNVKLTTTNGIDFSPATTICYPQSGTVDFVAYYPYESSFTTPYLYKVDVSDQSTPTGIDLLYSNNATLKDYNTNVVNLVFDHMMSQIVLNIKANRDITALSVKIIGMPTLADFDLATGTLGTPTAVADIMPIAVTPPTSSYTATFLAIVVPQVAGAWSHRKLVFTLGTEVYEYAIEDSDVFTLGKIHPYDIQVNQTGISVSSGDVVNWTTSPPETVNPE